MLKKNCLLSTILLYLSCKKDCLTFAFTMWSVGNFSSNLHWKIVFLVFKIIILIWPVFSRSPSIFLLSVRQYLSIPSVLIQFSTSSQSLAVCRQSISIWKLLSMSKLLGKVWTLYHFTPTQGKFPMQNLHTDHAIFSILL